MNQIDCKIPDLPDNNDGPGEQQRVPTAGVRRGQPRAAAQAQEAVLHSDRAQRATQQPQRGDTGRAAGAQR